MNKKKLLLGALSILLAGAGAVVGMVSQKADIDEAVEKRLSQNNEEDEDDD